MDDLIIEEIKDSIIKNASILTSRGVTKGTAGLSLFYFYYSKYVGDDGCKKDIMHHLEDSINGLNNEYSGTNIISDIIEIGLLLNFFCKNNVLNSEDVEFYFQNFDPILLDLLKETVEHQNISATNGAIKFGYYFLRDKERYLNELEAILALINRLSHTHTQSQGVYWHSSILRNGNYLIELSGLNGLSGIINFLLEMSKSGIRPEETNRTIVNALNYLQYYKSEKPLAQFPFDSGSLESSENYNLAYGDLCIGYAFLKAGKILRIQPFYQEGINILRNFSNFRDDSAHFIKDANILYGSSGLISMFRLLKIELNTTEFDHTIAYWQQKTTSFKRNVNEWAGYMPHYNQFDINTPLSLTDGLIGIGITLIEQKLDLRDFGYLNFLNYKL
jgi:hypothetical protein